MAGSIAKRPDGRWRARYRDRAGKEHARHFTRKVDAQAWLDDVTTAKATGTYVDPQQARTTVAVVVESWLAAHPDWTESTRVRNQSIVDRHIRPTWENVKLGDIDHDQLQTWVGKLVDSGAAGGTVRKVAGVMNGILGQAVLSKKLAVNPMTGVRLPKQALAPRRYLTGVQVEQLAAAAGDDSLTVLVLAYCGLRIGELAALRVKHVDMLRKRFRVEESVTEVNGALVWSSPKDHQRRSVPFPDFLTKDVGALLKGRAPDDLLFPAPRGGALRVRNMRRSWFDAAAKVAGVAGLTPHELRHTAASLAVSAGASVLALQRMLGHEKPSVTLDVYADLFDEDLDQVADSLHTARSGYVADYLRTRDEKRLAIVGS
ncbi:tyrosine-type recombinase/integrase [Ammonicoccus fulvus]|uniref:Tyrosine-type recombinase/integrase n=1 Tax=Ammonicoccus fulvus TaxID=3138240 RepID=A0ABZ3FQB7_9ACTN